MQPVTHEWFPRCGFALRNFVFVVREGEIDAAGVNIDGFAQEFHGHRGAFDVPARAARPNGRFPEMFARLWRLPQSEIPGAFFFVAIVVHPRARLDSAQVNLGQFAVVLELCDAVVNRTFGIVGIRLFLQPLDQLHHGIDIFRGTDPVLGRFHAERFAIREKRLHILFRVFADSYSGCGGVADDAVVDVGQIHHVRQLEAAQLQEAAQNILKDECAEIADMREVVDRRAAGVHVHNPRLQRDERFNFSRQGVVDLDFVHGPSAVPFDLPANVRLYLTICGGRNDGAELVSWSPQRVILRLGFLGRRIST